MTGIGSIRHSFNRREAHHYQKNREDSSHKDSIEGDAPRRVVYTFTAEARTYPFCAVADRENQLAEFSDANNVAMRSMDIKGPGETYGPDVIPQTIDISDDTVADAQILQINGLVYVMFQNKGDEKIDPSLW